jgi:hypothetical protein
VIEEEKAEKQREIFDREEQRRGEGLGQKALPQVAVDKCVFTHLKCF